MRTRTFATCIIAELSIVAVMFVFVAITLLPSEPNRLLAQPGDGFQPQVTANPSIVVAASDSSAKAKASADYVCDGTNDEVTIQAAIDSLPTTSTTVYTTLAGADRSTTSSGSTVFFCAGTYNIDGVAVNQATKLAVVLEGEGASTVVKNNQTDGGNAIEANVANPATTAHPWRCEVRNMMIQGNAQSGYGIYWQNGDCQRLSNVHFVHNGLGGAYIGASEDRGMNNKIVSDCQFLRNYGHGLHLYNIHETLVANCHIEENGGTDSTKAGLYADTCTDLHLSNCSIEDHASASGVHGMKILNAVLPQISNVVVEDLSTITLYAAVFTNKCLITDCLFNDFVTWTGGTNGAFYMTGGYVPFSTGCSSRITVLSGSEVYLANGGSFTNSDMFSMTGCYVWVQTSGTFTISSSADSTRTVISGCQLGSGAAATLALDGNSRAHVRAEVSGNSDRYLSLTCEDVTHLNVSSNVLMSGTLALINCDGTATMIGSTLYNMPVTVDNTNAATQNLQCNTITGSNITQAGTGTIVNANNVVVSGTGWNP
jgi:hypothetical protein